MTTMTRMTTPFVAAAMLALCTSALAGERNQVTGVDGAARVPARVGAKLTPSWRVAAKPGGTLTLEAVDANGAVAAGFLIHADVDDEGALRWVTIAKIGGKSGLVLDGNGKVLQSNAFSARDLALLDAARDDLGALDSVTNSEIARSWLGDWMDSIDGVMACVKAALVSTDVISDAQCAVAAVKASL
jgi:hypothetical protein